MQGLPLLRCLNLTKLPHDSPARFPSMVSGGGNGTRVVSEMPHRRRSAPHPARAKRSLLAVLFIFTSGLKLDPETLLCCLSKSCYCNRERLAQKSWVSWTLGLSTIWGHASSCTQCPVPFSAEFHSGEFFFRGRIRIRALHSLGWHPVPLSMPALSCMSHASCRASTHPSPSRSTSLGSCGLWAEPCPP